LVTQYTWDEVVKSAAAITQTHEHSRSLISDVAVANHAFRTQIIRSKQNFEAHYPVAMETLDNIKPWARLAKNTGSSDPLAEEVRLTKKQAALHGSYPDIPEERHWQLHSPYGAKIAHGHTSKMRKNNVR